MLESSDGGGAGADVYAPPGVPPGTDGSMAEGSSPSPVDGAPGPTDGSPGASDAPPPDAAHGGDAGACPPGISWASPGPGLGQACGTEGQICEDPSCKNSCFEPCNSLQCFECDALKCANGTWQSATVPLEMCDGGTSTHAPSCTTAADCRLFSFYCPSAPNDCSCDILGLTDPNPVCEAGAVDCLVDPCGGHTAICDSSLHCAIQ